MRDNGVLAVGILLSAHFRISGRKCRVREHLGIATRVAGKGAVASINSLVVPTEEIIRHAKPGGFEAVGAVETTCTFQPR